jgi:hypothetical protein
VGVVVIEKFELPNGVLGFRAAEKLTRADYTEVLIPALREALESGNKLRMLFQIGPGFHGMDAGALWEDMKADLTVGLPHASAWDRIAIVSDESWVKPAFSMLGWMAPGDNKTFTLDEYEHAKAWVTGG